MAVSAKTNKRATVKDLNSIDCQVLSSLYTHRCLDNNLLDRHYFRENGSRAYRMRKLSEFGLVKKENYCAKHYYFLTTKGVNLARSILGVSGDREPTASQLRINERVVSHQLLLNKFVLAFQEKAAKAGFSDYEYFDELRQSQYSWIRPDGIISLPDCDIFLEIDTGAERVRQLNEKWLAYEQFLSTEEFHNAKKPIQVLVVSYGGSGSKRRVSTIMKTLSSQLIPVLRSGLNIYVGSHEEMLKKLTTRFVFPGRFLKYKAGVETRLKRKGYSVTPGNSISAYLGGENYDYYIKKVDLKESGHSDEPDFVVDVFGEGPFSDIRKAFQFLKRETAYHAKTGKHLKYIMVVGDIDDMYYFLNIAEALEIKEVYYTTTVLLKAANKELWECLHGYRNAGFVTKYTDKELLNSCYYRNVIEKGWEI